MPAADVYTLYRELYKAYNDSGLTGYADVILKAKNILATYPTAPQLFSDASLITSFAAMPSQGLPLSFWAGGGYWDLTTIAGANGSPFTTPIASSIGTGVLTPGNSPLVDTVAMWGNRGLDFVDTGNGATMQYLRNDALCPALQAAARGTGDLTIAMRFRSTKLAEMPLWSGHVSSNPGYFGARMVSQRSCLRKTSDSGVTVTATGTLDTQYDDHIYHWTFSKLTGLWTQYIDGVVDVISNAGLDTLAVTLNAFVVAGDFSTSPFEAATGKCQLFGLSTQWATQTQVTAHVEQLLAQNYVKQFTDPGVKRFLLCGASIENGATDEVNGAGDRATITNAIIANRWSLASAGPFTQGLIPNRNTPSVSGADAPAIALQVLNYWTSRTGFAVMDLGNGEINATFTAPQTLTAIQAALMQVRTARPSLPIVVNKVRAYFEAPLNTVTIAVNAGLAAVWDAVDAAFPGQPTLYRWDANAALGGPSYVQIYYGFADDHPIHLGYSTEGPALLAASNATGQTLLQLMQSLSLT